MKLRFDDATGLGAKVFDGWFKSRNEQFAGKIWNVWSQTLTAGVKKDDPTKAGRPPKDDLDREVLRTGQPTGRFVGDSYRFSMPVVWGKTPTTKQGVCLGCHQELGAKDNEVVSLYQSAYRRPRISPPCVIAS